jgi:hypothetical protein
MHVYKYYLSTNICTNMYEENNYLHVFYIVYINLSFLILTQFVSVHKVSLQSFQFYYIFRMYTVRPYEIQSVHRPGAWRAMKGTVII